MRSDDPRTPPERLASRFAQAWNRPVSKSFVVGLIYSRLMGQDETGTLACVRTHRRELVDLKIAEHRGRIVKTTGDGLLACPFHPPHNAVYRQG